LQKLTLVGKMSRRENWSLESGKVGKIDLGKWQSGKLPSGKRRGAY